MSESRPDPRKRPPDPAGTQPKVDPESLRTSIDDARPALSDTHTSAVLAPGSEETSGHEHQLPAAISSNGAVAVAAPAVVLKTDTERATGSAAAADESLLETGKSGVSAVAVRSPANPHAPRFQFLFGALGALSVAAIALVIALLRAPAPAPQRPWSAWQPPSNDGDPAQQIAAYVAPHYRLPSGRQIVEAVGGPPSLDGQPLFIAINHSGQKSALLEGNNVLYQLCGDGEDCSIKEGKPSAQRGLYVAREALELALYTFHYVPGVDHVIVTMPPPPPASAVKSSSLLKAVTSAAQATSGLQTNGASATTAPAHVVRHALIFSQQDLAPELDQPLGETLSTVTPQVAQMNHWPDAVAVKMLTDPHVYDFTISEIQQNLVMLLQTPGLGG
jgi:hypothetical protein